MRTLIISLLFLASAMFHALALTWPSISIPESQAEHVLFVIVNLWLANSLDSAFLSLRNLGRFFIAFVILSVHQVIVHGYFFGAAIAKGTFDFQSLTVLLGLVFAWTLLITHLRHRRIALRNP